MIKTANYDSTLNLYQAQSRGILRILLILGDWKIRRSFNQIGIHAGDFVRILSRAPFGGPLVIDNRGTQVAIGKQLAEKIVVAIT
jgi:DtxR family transcriptional regulator, Mn-dependent transcriptional regulator